MISLPMPKSPEVLARNAEYIRQYRKTHPTVGKRVSVTFSEEEYTILQRDAKAHKETIAGHLRRLALSALEHRPVISLEAEERANDFVRTIRGIANNLNQMARYSNTMRAMLDDREVGYQLRYMEDAFRAFLEGRDREGRGGKPP